MRSRSGSLLILVLCVATLVTGSEASGEKKRLPLTPVGCGTEITRSIRVANSVWDCPLSGLIVKASGITVDLNGFTIDGNDTDNAVSDGEYGIDVLDGLTKVTVRNGTVRDFEGGVGLRAATSRATVSGIYSESNVIAFSIGGTDHLIRRNTAVANARGIFVSAPGTVVSRNTSSANSADGFDVPAARRLERNVAVGNGERGFEVNGANMTIIENRSVGNDEPGFAVSGSSNALTKNVAIGGNSAGFTVNGSVTLSRNVASGTGDDGFRLSGGVRATRNVAKNTDGSGFELSGVGGVLSRNRSTGNRVYGISVAGDAHVLTRNVVVGNGFDGVIDSGGTGRTYTNNRVDRNGFLNGIADGFGLGFNLFGGFADLVVGGNTAKGNDHPAQCTPNAACN